MERNILRRAAVTATAFTFTIATATASFASDCSSKTKKSATNQTSVMGATVYKTGGQYSSASTYSSSTIIDAAVSTPELSTLTAAVKAAGLVGTLNGDGPFTVFAPTNAAFDALPDGTVASLLRPENQAALTNILTSHVVAGNYSAADIVALVEANGGKAYIATLSGAKLKVKKMGDALTIKDESGNKSTVAIADIMKSNGTVHVINGVLLPKSDGTS